MRQKELVIEPMQIIDLMEVLSIERQSYVNPWSIHLFLNELNDNHYSRYLVLKQEGKVIGYGGMWIFLEEAHITNLAVRPDFRNKGYGRMILKTLMEKARERGADSVTLEVRVSNKFARRLYEGTGFKEVGLRKKYNGNEDALLMTCYFTGKQI